MKVNIKKKSLLLAMAAMVSIGLMAGCGNDQKAGDTGKKTVKVGVVQIVQHPALDAANKGFVDGLASKGYKVGENITIDQQNAQGDQSNLNTISNRFIADKVDLIGAIATPSAQTVANQTKEIPIVGMAITDYVSAKLVKSNEKPSGNVTGTSDFTPAEKVLDLILAIMPNVKTIGTIYSSSEVNSQVQVNAFKKVAEAKGIKLVEVTVSNVNDIQQAAESLKQRGIEAVYVPTDNVVASAYPNLMSIMTTAKIPVFPTDSGALKSGGLAALSVDYYKLGFQAGVMAAKILKGEGKPADMPVELGEGFKVYINKDQAALLGIQIPKDLLDKAEK